MNGYVVVDASVWVARLVAHDAFYQTSREWLEKQRTAGVTFLAPALLLAEVAGAVSRRTGEAPLARRALQALEALPDLRLVDLDGELVQTAARLAADLGLRGADAFYVAVAARLQVPLATLDADQREKAANAIAIQEP